MLEKKLFHWSSEHPLQTTSFFRSGEFSNLIPPPQKFHRGDGGDRRRRKKKSCPTCGKTGSNVQVCDPTKSGIKTAVSPSF